MVVIFIIFSFILIGGFGLITIDQHYDNTLWGTSIESKQIVVKELRYRDPIVTIEDTDSSFGKVYIGYYLENNMLKRFIVPVNDFKTSKLNIKETNDNQISINYRIKKNRYGSNIYDESNSVNIRLKSNYEILNEYDSPVYSGDLKKRKIFKKECVDKITYKNNMFTFYQLDKQMNSFTFKDSEENKLKFKTGDTKDRFACVNFNYTETHSRKIVKEKHAASIFEVTVSEDFDIDSITITE